MHDGRMSIGIITGASRGLGLALTRALAARGWTLVVDARDERALAEATEGLDGVVAVAGDVTDPAPPGARSSRPPATGSTSSSTTPARSGRARSPRSPPIRSTCCAASSRSTCSPRSPSSRRRCRAWRRGARVVDITLRRRRRAVPRLGRLRLVEGGARPAHRDPREPSTRSCASTRSTPATCARRCTRRRSRARTSPTGRRRRTACPGLLALVEGDAAERPLPGRRARAARA